MFLDRRVADAEVQRRYLNMCPQMDVYYTASPCSLSLKRLPALTLTLGLELVGGLIIDQLHKVRPLRSRGLAS